MMRTSKNISGSDNIEYRRFNDDSYILTLKESHGSIKLEDK